MFFMRSPSPIAPATCPGVPVPVGILTLTVSCFTPTLLSTVTPLAMSPLLPARFTVTSIGPLAPGSIFHGCDGSLATVQPQEVRTLLIKTSDDETLVSQKVNGAVASPDFAWYSLVSASHFRAFRSAVAAGATGTACG